MIPVNSFSLDGKESEYLNDCLNTGWISSAGKYIDLFEESFSNYIGVKYGTAVSNGSAALDVAIASLELKENDEIILPSFTIISPVFSVIRNGQKPVLVDVDPLTWNMNVSQIEEKITPKTKAIIVVHIYGLPVDMDPVINLCKKYDLYLIEDSAEAHGVKYKNQLCGSFGHLACFSFYPNKHITSGEGGMILTNDFQLKERCDKLRNLSFEPTLQRFIHLKMGWNYRMTNMQAAVGLAQLEKINLHLQRKLEVGIYYYQHLSSSDLWTVQPSRTDYSENLFWVFGMNFHDELIKNKFESYLKKNGIDNRPFFYGMHMQPVFLNNNLFKGESYPVTEQLSKCGLYIPSGISITRTQQDYIIDKILRFKV